jgi:hypothetical protein
MFDSLAEQMKHDEQVQISSQERMVRWFAVAILSVVAFGGLYYGVQMLQ